MSDQLKLCFTHWRPDSGSARTIAGSTGSDLDDIAESFGLCRRGVLIPTLGNAETDDSLRKRVAKALDEYYEGI